MSVGSAVDSWFCMSTVAKGAGSDQLVERMMMAGSSFEVREVVRPYYKF